MSPKLWCYKLSGMDIWKCQYIPLKVKASANLYHRYRVLSFYFFTFDLVHRVIEVRFYLVEPFLKPQPTYLRSISLSTRQLQNANPASLKIHCMRQRAYAKSNPVLTCSGWPNDSMRFMASWHSINWLSSASSFPPYSFLRIYSTPSFLVADTLL